MVTGTFNREYEKVVRRPIKMCDVDGENRQEQQCGVCFLDVTIVDQNDNGNYDGSQFINVNNFKGNLNPTFVNLIMCFQVQKGHPECSTMY